MRFISFASNIGPAAAVPAGPAPAPLPTVSKSRRSRRSKRVTYLECATNMDTTTQISMKMEHLSSELFISWLQAGRRQNFCRAKKAKQLRLDAPLVPPEPITPAPNKLRPSVPKETFEGSRAKGKTTDYSMKLWHMWQTPRIKKFSVTLSQT